MLFRSIPGEAVFWASSVLKMESKGLPSRLVDPREAKLELPSEPEGANCFTSSDPEGHRPPPQGFRPPARFPAPPPITPLLLLAAAREPFADPRMFPDPRPEMPMVPTPTLAARSEFGLALPKSLRASAPPDEFFFSPEDPSWEATGPIP